MMRESSGQVRLVRGTVNYMRPMDGRPIYSNRQPTEMALDPVEVTIADAGSYDQPPSLDVEGFAAVHHGYPIDGIEEPREGPARYHAALAPFMREVTGADEVLVCPPSIFRRQAAPVAAGDLKPVQFIHSDFTIGGAPSMMERSYFFSARFKVRRTAMLNMWKLLSEGPTDWPLALCDARSVAADDVVIGESRHHLDFETSFFRSNPAHRWAYFPKLTSDDLLVFKQSDSDPARPRIVPHTAFEDASAGPGAVPRVSIESRCLAIWFE